MKRRNDSNSNANNATKHIDLKARGNSSAKTNKNTTDSYAYTKENRIVTKKNKEGSHFVENSSPSKEKSSLDTMYVNGGYSDNISQYQQNNWKYEHHSNFKNMSREQNGVFFEDVRKEIPQTYKNRRYYYS